MMCNRQVEAVKPFRKPFKVTPRPGSEGKRVLKQQRQKSSKKVGMEKIPPRWGQTNQPWVSLGGQESKMNELKMHTVRVASGTTSGGAF